MTGNYAYTVGDEVVVTVERADTLDTTLLGGTLGLESVKVPD